MRTQLINRWLAATALSMATILAGCGGHVDPAGGSTTPTTTTPTTAAVASLNISSSKTSVASNNLDTATITVQSLSASNGLISDVTVAVSADSGIISTSLVKTDSTGSATFKFSSGASNYSNRTANITATAGSATATFPISIEGSTVAISSTAMLLPNDGLSSATLTITARNEAGSPVAKTKVDLATDDGTIASLAKTTGETDVDGEFSTTVVGKKAGAVKLTASALGATGTIDLTVQSVVQPFGISSVTRITGDAPNENRTAVQFSSGSVAMSTSEKLEITVSAPSPAANVRFAATQGKFDTDGFVEKRVASGVATATLSSSQAGVADVVAFDPDNPQSSSRLTVGMTATEPATIALQSSPNVVAKSSGSIVGSSQLLATVLDSANQPVGNAVVFFSIKDGTQTGGGEHFSSAIATTYAGGGNGSGLTLGQAFTSFLSGSLSSSGGGVTVVASVAGTGIVDETNIVIGGTAGSVAISESTKIASIANDSAYELPMSLVVADSSGNAQSGVKVTLSIWPIAFNTGTEACIATPYRWFYNEDRNENLIIENAVAGQCARGDEDGDRAAFQPEFPSAPRPTPNCGATLPELVLDPVERKLVPDVDEDGNVITSFVTSSVDGRSTPTNSDGGAVDSVVTTGANGVASFKLTYPKNSAIWTFVRLRASTVVQGTETVAEKFFALPALLADVSPNCLLRNGYKF